MTPPAVAVEPCDEPRARVREREPPAAGAAADLARMQVAGEHEVERAGGSRCDDAGKWQSRIRKSAAAIDERRGAEPRAPVRHGVDADDLDALARARPSTASSRSSRRRSRPSSSAARENGSRVTATSWFPRTT